VAAVPDVTGSDMVCFLFLAKALIRYKWRAADL
jgi:hypothetical protein